MTTILLHRVQNFVGFRRMIFVFTLLKCTIFDATRPQFDDQPLFGTLAFRNGLEYHTFGLRVVIGTHFCKSHRNLVRFVSVSPELNTQEVAQSASKIFLE